VPSGSRSCCTRWKMLLLGPSAPRPAGGRGSGAKPGAAARTRTDTHGPRGGDCGGTRCATTCVRPTACCPPCAAAIPAAVRGRCCCMHAAGEQPFGPAAAMAESPGKAQRLVMASDVCLPKYLGLGSCRRQAAGQADEQRWLNPLQSGRSSCVYMQQCMSEALHCGAASACRHCSR
jgi:hypothetical protein